MVRQRLVKQIRENHPKDFKIQHLTDDEIEQYIFRRPKGIRLTFDGYRLLSKFVKPYIFTHDDDFKAKHITALASFKYPFYLSRKSFVLFSEEDALLLSLHGSVIAFLESSSIFRD